MPKIKRVGNSKVPLAHQLPIIVSNLISKLNLSYVNLELDSTSYGISTKPKSTYKICFQPGLDNSECSFEYFKTWPELLTCYHKLMRS